MKRTLQRELSSSTPRMEHDLDRSVDEAGMALSKTLREIDQRTSNEQRKLLNGYRSFLQRQVEFVERKIKALEGEF